MKKFLLGTLCATLVLSLSISALAISGRMTIEVDPVNIQVNGQTFVPKDVNGAEVPVFAYNGTTYAPLRALAEAYGLEVGYDAEQNMATVVASDEVITVGDDNFFAPSSDDDAAYQEFKAMWTLVKEDTDGYLPDLTYMYCGTLSKNELHSVLCQAGDDVLTSYGEKMIAEWSDQHNLPFGADIYFFYNNEDFEYFDHGHDSGVLGFVDCVSGLGSGYGLWNISRPTQH